VTRRVIVGAALSIAISIAGERAGALTRRGALAACGVGAAVAGGASWPGMLVLGTFFVSSSAISRIGRPSDVAEKGSRRDARQVLANGGLAALGALALPITGERVALTLASGALVAAAADTWATELGSTSPAPPRLLVGGAVVRRGVSGGVTARGLLASVAGAGLIGAVTALAARQRFRVTGGAAARTGAAVVVAGATGSLVDSLLGQFAQERRHCPRCDEPTEAREHRCGSATTRIGGVPGVTNDVVNVGCTLAGLLVALALDRQ
jgi:uncharacterized protein (TIGR00297 family)